MPHLFERAPTGRAKCRGCGASLAAGEWRFGERLPNPFAEGDAEMTHWFHPACAAFKRPEAFVAWIDAGGWVERPGASDAPDRDLLEREARLGIAHRRLARVDAASRAPSGRASCRACRSPIEKGTWRIGLVYYEDGRFVPSGFIHPGCAREYLETVDILPRVRHFSQRPNPLSEDEIRDLAAAIG